MAHYHNTLSRAELSETEGSCYDIHYGDVLIKFGSVLDLDETSLPRITDDSVAAKLSCETLRDGDVILADTAEDEAVGKCAELRKVGNSTVYPGLHTMPIRPVQEYASGFLGHYLNAPAFHDQLIPLMQGIKVISVSRSAIADATLVVPCVEEQRAIAQTFDQLDNLITLHQREQSYEGG